MNEYIDKSHNVTLLICHLVFPAKYRRAVFDEDVDMVMKDVCIEIEDRYQMKVLQIRTDRDHVHFFVQCVPTYTVVEVVSTIKSLTGREIFKRCSQVKKRPWGGEFRTDGYFASTDGRHVSENTIAVHVKQQGKVYRRLHEDRQLRRF